MTTELKHGKENTLSNSCRYLVTPAGAKEGTLRFHGNTILGRIASTNNLEFSGGVIKYYYPDEQTNPPKDTCLSNEMLFFNNTPKEGWAYSTGRFARDNHFSLDPAIIPATEAFSNHHMYYPGADKSRIMISGTTPPENSTIVSGIMSVYSGEPIDRLNLPWNLQIRNLTSAAILMAFLEERNLMHGDLRTDNILTNSFGNTSVIDFGTALRKLEDTGGWAPLTETQKLITGYSENTASPETHYLAAKYTGKPIPKILNDTRVILGLDELNAESYPISPKSDVYSFGIVLGELALRYDYLDEPFVRKMLKETTNASPIDRLDWMSVAGRMALFRDTQVKLV